MSSSVASSKHMEKWAAERREKSATSVPVNVNARRNFSSFQPDMAQLEKFEERVHRHVERQEMKANELETEAVINVMGSTAGAGSGDFHMYRGYRTKEMARLKDFEQDRRRDEAQKEWEKERDERAAELDERVSKRAAKRAKQKAKQKEAQREAKQAKAAGAAGGAGEGQAGAVAGSKRSHDEALAESSQG